MDNFKKQLVRICVFGVIMGFAYVLFHIVFYPQREPEVEVRKLNSYISVLVIDSCEYIKTGRELFHKKNCRFCAKRNLHKSQNESDISEYNEE